jgi:hypothetical protein
MRLAEKIILLFINLIRSVYSVCSVVSFWQWTSHNIELPILGYCPFTPEAPVNPQ